MILERGCRTETIVIALIDELDSLETINAINNIVDDRPVDVYIPEDIDDSDFSDEIENFIRSIDPNIYVIKTFDSENDGKYYCEAVKDILFDLDKKEVFVIYAYHRYSTMFPVFFYAVVSRAISFAYHQHGIWTIEISTSKNNKGSVKNGKKEKVSENEKEGT